ncbi:MAG: glycosyltransferase [Candidatus Gygaella obscura]|nr:glycosyltransferase [Candidatus Gygaella obscura]
MIDTSIIILTKNAQKTIFRLLQSIFNQDIDASFEVICLDSESTDTTLEIIDKFPVRLVSVSRNEFNHGLTRNLGMMNSKGENVFFLTQDAIPIGKDWMRYILNMVNSDSSIAGVYCDQVLNDNVSFFECWQLSNYLPENSRISFIDDKDYYNTISPKERLEFCRFDNVCSCIRRSVWTKVPFRKMSFGEDLDWGKRIIETGLKIAFCKEAKVLHLHSYSLIGILTRSFYTYRLYNSLFGFKPFYSLKDLFINMVIFPIKAVRRYLNTNKKLFLKIINIPFIGLFSLILVFGQYLGSIKNDEDIIHST